MTDFYNESMNYNLSAWEQNETETMVPSEETVLWNYLLHRVTLKSAAQ